MNKAFLSLMLVGLIPALFGQAYGGGPTFEASENSENLVANGFPDTILDNPCDGTLDDGTTAGTCREYELTSISQLPFIKYNPSFGALHKHLQDPATDCDPDSPICKLTEVFSVGGDFTITDWHEILFEPEEMTWVSVTVTINPKEFGFDEEIVLTESDDNVMIGQTFTPDDTLWIIFPEPFDPLSSELIKIEKTFAYGGFLPVPFNEDGSDCPPPSGTTDDCEHPFGEITVLEFPSITPPPPPPVVGGENIPIESTSLILAGAQTFSWMIPVVLSVLGIGLFVVSRKSENS